jgi:hypothetical protein
VETNFDAFVFLGCQESVDAVGDSVGSLGVEEPGLDEALGDSFLSRECLFAFKSSSISNSRLDGMRDSLSVPEWPRRERPKGALFPLR